MKRETCNEPKRSIFFLIILQGLRVLIQVFLYREGFISLSADEFSRGIRAAKWSLNPSFNIFNDVHDIWLPLEKYLNGSVLMFWPDVIWAPRVTVFVASSVLIIFLFLAVYLLFSDFSIAAISVIFVSIHPWFAWLSGTPMLDLYSLAFFMMGLFFLIHWLRDHRRGHWVTAGCCFLVSTGFHTPCWVYVNVINLLTLGILFKNFTNKRYNQVLQLIGYYFLSNLLIIIFSLIQYINSGKLFGFLSSHTQYSKWFYQGYNVAIWEKLTYYPSLIFENVSVFFWPLLLIGLFFLIKGKNGFWKWSPIFLALISLLINSVMNSMSGPPSAAPGRYSLFYIMLMAPLIGIAVSKSYGWYREHATELRSVLLGTIILLLFLGNIAWGIAQIPKFSNGMSWNAINTGKALHQLLKASPGDRANSYVLELVYWDYLGVELSSWSFDNVVYDREMDVFDRNTPSIFLEDDDSISSFLSRHNVRYIVLRSQDLATIVSDLNYIRPIRTIENWSIFEFSPYNK